MPSGRKSPWTAEMDEALCRFVAQQFGDAEIAERMRPYYQGMTFNSVKRRRLTLRVGLRRPGGKRPPRKDMGPQRHCLDCRKPFRHKDHYRCKRCLKLAEKVAA